MIKKLALVFILAFLLNWIWENAHSVLYLSYRGGPITYFILLKAAAADAAIIIFLVFIAGIIPKHKTLFVAVGGLVLAVAIELWALKTGRWAYSASMPLVPIIKVGLSPALQLAVTGYIALKLRVR
ncbi:MAG: hypothetical protein QMD77_04995 [Patescibacteria group bacterium]|nr:hypothetical protein [Patescibacteria group bacterium]